MGDEHLLSKETETAIVEMLSGFLDELDDLTDDLQGDLLEDVRLVRRSTVATVNEVIEGRLSAQGAKRNLARLWMAVRNDLCAAQQEAVARRGDIILKGIGGLVSLITSVGAPVLKPILGPIIAAALGG